MSTRRETSRLRRAAWYGLLVVLPNLYGSAMVLTGTGEMSAKAMTIAGYLFDPVFLISGALMAWEIYGFINPIEEQAGVTSIRRRPGLMMESISFGMSALLLFYTLGMAGALRMVSWLAAIPARLLVFWFWHGLMRSAFHGELIVNKNSGMVTVLGAWRLYRFPLSKVKHVAVVKRVRPGGSVVGWGNGLVVEGRAGHIEVGNVVETEGQARSQATLANTMFATARG